MRGALPVALLLALPVAACSEGGDDAGRPTVTATTSEPEPSDIAGGTGRPGDTGGAGARGRPEVLESVATRLEVPWGLDFLPDGRAVVTERDNARVLLVDPDGGTPQEAGVVAAAEPEGEGGLLGVAVSPDFRRDRTLYLYATRASDNAVLRARLGADDTISTPEPILEGIPKGFIHNGGRLAFGPDGFLYVSTGETGDGPLAQDPGSLGGKILRITTDGEPAPGNPDPRSPVWTLGHRNVQGLAFDDDGHLWASEFGQSTFDELNLVEKDDNYGWPEVEGRGDDADFTNPQVVWATSEASPSGLAYVDGTLWMAALGGVRLWRVDVSGERASAPADFFVGEYGRLRTVVAAPDGRLWITTSNRDGRGVVNAGDDQILVVDPGL